MSDPAIPAKSLALPAPGGDDKPATTSAAPRARPADSRGAGFVLTALAVVLLFAGLTWVWTQQQQFAEAADVAALREQLRTLQLRLAQAEQRQPATSAATDLRPLESRLSALEQRPAAVAADPAMAGRLAALDQRVLAAERAAARTLHLARLQRAVIALDAGQPLGELPGAPPALTRFTSSAPPTLTALRLDFPAAAQRARAASPTADSEQGIGARIWQRVLNLVTVRAGDTVLVGTPAAIVLGQASERLGSGDLAGAVAALDALDPAGSAAIVDWRTAATSLLAARSALAALMAPGIAE